MTLGKDFIHVLFQERERERESRGRERALALFHYGGRADN